MCPFKTENRAWLLALLRPLCCAIDEQHRAADGCRDGSISPLKKAPDTVVRKCQNKAWYDVNYTPVMPMMITVTCEYCEMESRHGGQHASTAQTDVIFMLIWTDGRDHTRRAPNGTEWNTRATLIAWKSSIGTIGYATYAHALPDNPMYGPMGAWAQWTTWYQCRWVARTLGTTFKAAHLTCNIQKSNRLSLVMSEQSLIRPICCRSYTYFDIWRESYKSFLPSRQERIRPDGSICYET
jgi:hypothetical protein